MIVLARLRELDLASAPAAGRPPHLSAASGIVCVKSHIYVVADDELHLGVFRPDGKAPGRLIRLFDGELPDSKPHRKSAKPDLEALTLLPADTGYPHGALLALGSGSTQRRERGAFLVLDRHGAPADAPRAIDCSPLFASLASRVPALNIEGAVVSGGEMRLFQRGNRLHPANAIIRYPFSAVREAFASGRMGAADPLGIHRVDLGDVDGIPYSFTDAAALPDGRTLFTAVAEDTNDSYNDGPCVGAGIGLLDQDGTLRWLRPLDRPHKVEGIDARIDGGVIRLLLVTDADDPDRAASLFSATLET